MRVHLRGVVIGVGILLSVVIIVSIFNAFDTPTNSKRTRNRHALSMEGDQESGSSGSRTSPRSSARLRPQPGPRPARAGATGARAGATGARAGATGARAGGTGMRPGSVGARSSGPGAHPGLSGARPGGPAAHPEGLGARIGGPGARIGGLGARIGGLGARTGGPVARTGVDGERPSRKAPRDTASGDSQDEDETPSQDAKEATLPKVRTGGAASRVAGRPSPRVRSKALDDDEIPSEDVEGDTLSNARNGEAAGKMPGRQGTRVRSRVFDDGDETLTGNRATGGAIKRRSARKEPKADKSSEETEELEKPKKKKEPPYPEWWKEAYPRSATADLKDQFVGDQPLFPMCPNVGAGFGDDKGKRFGPVEPQNYMRNSKNPCWFEWNGKKDMLKCVPKFYIAGVPKAATADLFHRLQVHPNVMKGGAVAYYWWDRLRYGASKFLKYTKEAKRSDDLVPLKDYAKVLVANHGKNITKELLYMGKSDSIFGDATPTYLVENTQWDIFEGNEGCSEPRVLVASFIRHMYPEARIIVLLRDPIERLYSRFLANVPYVEEYENHTDALFHTFTTQAVQHYHECFHKYSIRHCAYNASLFVSSVIRLSEGMYPIFLEDWFRIFPKEQILILKFEDYIKDLQGHLLRVFQHLELDPLDKVDMLKLTELPVVRKGQLREEAGDMKPETVSLLSQFYAPFNQKLAQLLDDDKWLFSRTSNEPPVKAAHKVTMHEDKVPQKGEKHEDKVPQKREKHEDKVPQKEETHDAAALGGDESKSKLAAEPEEGDQDAVDNNDDI